MRTRSIKKQFWINKEEATILKNKSKKVGLNESDFLRLLIVNTKLKEKPDDRFYDVMKDMRAIGNNLNQIARVANSTGNISHDYKKEAEVWNEFMIKIKKEYLL